MHVFYTPDISSDEYVLNEEESKHCIKVLRLGAGALVYLIDGRGGRYKAQIIGESKRNVQLKVVEFHQDQKRQHHLHIAVAPTKNIDRIEWFLEKATEIGIEEITPLICDRSERKTVKEDRLQKIITSAVKQSLQAYHPILRPQTDFKDFIKQDHSDAIRMVAHCIENEEKQYISQLAVPKQKYTLLIGPEGDFTPQEIKLALDHNFAPLTLGNTRLRTETAALAACFEVNYLNR
ncbi:MAG: 16S rRNA (uracil(1498)-N(3))-methyltransferase [Bacteroidota bacterium]